MLSHTCTGNGDKTLIFVHGNSQDARTWHRLLQLPELTTFKLVTVDLPGHGKSFRSIDAETTYTLSGMAAHLADFITGLDIDEYVLVATSLGTCICAEALPLLTKKCRGLFFIGASIIGDDLTPMDILQPNAAAMVAFQETVTDAGFMAFSRSVVYDSDDVAAVEQYKQAFFETDPAFRRVLMNCVQTGGWSDELAAIRDAGAPVALVYGEADTIVQVDYLRTRGLMKWRDAILLVPAAGHSVQLDQPHVVAQLIAEFTADAFGGFAPHTPNWAITGSIKT